MAVGALLGTVIGASVGFTTAYIVAHGPHKGYVDHSEDGLLYLYFSVLGGFVGFVVGMITGYMHN